MQHYAAFHLGLHCLLESTRLGVSGIQKVNNLCFLKLMHLLLSSSTEAILKKLFAVTQGEIVPTHNFSGG